MFASFFPRDRLKKRALGNYRSNLRKSIRGHFQLSIPLFQSFEKENFVYNIISFRRFARSTAFPNCFFFYRFESTQTMFYSVSNRNTKFPCRIYLNVNALVTLYTVMYRRASLSLDRRPSKSSKLHISKQSIDSVTGHEYYRRNWSGQRSKDTNIFSTQRVTQSRIKVVVEILK